MAEKSLEEIKADILHRAGRINPFERVKKEDVEQVVKNITSLDRDLWGREWGKFGAKYEALAGEQESQGKKKEAGETYYLAYEYYRIGRYPVPSSPDKMNCYEGALRTFLKAAPTMDPPLERIEIPFEGKKVVGYLQVPRGVNRPPVVMHWGGVDGWKEDRRTNNDVLLKMGLACFTIDMPGTGENPCLGQRPARRADFLRGDGLSRNPRRYRRQTDRLHGRKLRRLLGGEARAHGSPSGCSGAVNWGAGVHRTFQEEWLRPGADRDGFPVPDGAGQFIGCAILYLSARIRSKRR